MSARHAEPCCVQSREAHYLAGQAGQASHAKIQAKREAVKEVRVASKSAGEAERAAAEEAEAAYALLFEPHPGHSTPRRPCTTGAPQYSPDPAANLLLSFAGASAPEPSASAPVPAASANAPPATSTAPAVSPVWLVLEPCDSSQQVGSTVFNHDSLFAWGKATVHAIEDGSGKQARCLCVEGRWSAVDEVAVITSAPSK